MPIVRFTKENLLEGKQLKPGWRVLKVKSVDSERPGKKNEDTTTYPVHFVINEGEDAGVPISSHFNNGQMKRLSRFIGCFTPEVKEAKDYQLEDTIGRLVQGYCLYNANTEFNEIKDFKSYEKK